jgi:hypothetical protein
MAESRWRRALRTLRDPWSLLVAAVGGGSAWAVGLPVLGAGGVAVGVLGAAAVVGAVVAAGGADDVPALRSGTDQARQIATLDGYLADIRGLGSKATGPVAERATEAVAAAGSAREVAVRVAAAVDDLDGAIGEAGKVAKTMTSKNRVAPSLQRMSDRRRKMLGQLSGAVDGVGELYTKLLELDASTDEPVDSGMDPVAELTSSLDAVREAFAELDSQARHARDGLT